MLSFILLFVLFSCGKSRTEQAQEQLNEILLLKESGSFNLAKLRIDSLVGTYSDQTEQVQKARIVMTEITILEQERSIEFLDSMLTVKELQLEPMMKNFIVTDEYGPEKILIHQQQKPENTYNRTFLRAHLKESGEFYISSRYHGGDWIYHQQIKVYNGAQSVLSDVIPEDGFDNRRFDDQGAKWEIVNYKGGRDNGIIDYIASHYNEPLKAQFIGKGQASIVLEKYDKEAIRDGYEISFVLKEMQQIKEEKEKAQQTLRKLKG
jgi:hypothetical protein